MIDQMDCRCPIGEYVARPCRACRARGRTAQYLTQGGYTATMRRLRDLANVCRQLIEDAASSPGAPNLAAASQALQEAGRSLAAYVGDDPLVYLHCVGDAEGAPPAPLSEYLEGREDLPPHDTVLMHLRTSGAWSNGNAIITRALEGEPGREELDLDCPSCGRPGCMFACERARRNGA